MIAAGTALQGVLLAWMLWAMVYSEEPPAPFWPRLWEFTRSLVLLLVFVALAVATLQLIAGS